MNRKMKKISAIVVAMAVMLVGVHVSTGNKYTKVAKAASTGYWEKTNTIYTKHDKASFSTCNLPGQNEECSYEGEVDVSGTKMVRFKWSSSRNDRGGKVDTTADWSCTWVSEGEVPPDRIEEDADVSLKLNQYIEDDVIRVSENVSDCCYIVADVSGREYYKMGSYSWKFKDASGNGSFARSIFSEKYMKDIFTSVTGKVKCTSDISHKDGDKRSIYFASYGGQMEWQYTFRSSGGSSATATPTVISTPKPTSSPTASVAPTSAPVQTSTPVATPIPTTEPEVTPAPTADPGTSTDVRSKPKFKTYWTNHQDVLNIYSTSGTKVKVKPLNKLAKSSSIRWIKNGKTAKICWKRNCRVGKYKFRFTCAGTASWKPGKTGWVITVS